MAPRLLAAPSFTRTQEGSELDRDTGVQGLLGAGAGHRADAGTAGVVIETELVFPVAIRDPDVHVVRVLRTPDHLAGIEGETDRLAVDLRLGLGVSHRIEGQRVGLVALRPVESGSAAD